MPIFNPSKSALYIALVAALIFVFGIEGLAQATVAGSVRDAEGEPVIGAYVTNGKSTIASDIDGNYILELSTGRHELACSFIGMGTEKKEFFLKNGDVVKWEVVLRTEARVLNIAVVSAGRFEQSIAEVTVSMEILQPALVESKATTSLESAIEQTPGVSMVDGEPQIRSGSGFSYGAGSRVMVMVDDLPVLSGDAGKPNWSFLPLENLEQIEIIKGASSVLYGSAALSGVINIRTRFPDARPLTRISIQHGVYSSPRTDSARYWDDTPENHYDNILQQSNIRFLHSRRLGGWDIVVGGNFLGDDGYKGPEVLLNEEGTPIGAVQSGFNPLTVDRYGANSQARINVNIRRRNSAIRGLTYGLSTNWQIGESLNTLIWENNTTGLYSSYAGGSTRTKQLVGTVDPFIEYLTESGVRISLRNRWQHLVNDNDNNQGNSSDVYYSELQAQKLGAWGLEKMAMTAGLVHQYTRGEAELYIGGETSGVNTARNIAAYMQLDQPLSEQLNLSLGVRYEYFAINDKSEGKPVFRAGANYQIAEETYMRASMGQGYRFPTIAEKFIRTGLGELQVYPNLDLKPETSTSLEVGVKQGMKLGAFMGYLDVAVFQQDYHDFIEFTFGKWSTDPDAPLFGMGFMSLNTGESRIRGYETSIMGQAKWGADDKHTIDLLAGYTYTNPVSLTPDQNYHPYAESNPSSTNVASYTNTSHDTSGNILKYRSQHLVRFDAQWTCNMGFIGVSARYQSAHQNFDQAFLMFESLEPDIEWGLQDWLDDHSNYDENGEKIDYYLPWIIDVRAGVNMSDDIKLALAVSNLFNREYAIRALAIESPRLVNLVFTYEI